jgi:hypothetical protein
MSLELAKKAVEEMRAEEKAEAAGLLPHEQKSLDWWKTRLLFSDFMYLDSADRGYQADKCREASKKYLDARAHWVSTYNEEFDFGMRPIDVSEVCPEAAKARV